MRGVRKKIEGGGYSGEGKEDKMKGGGVAKKIEGVMPERVKKTKYVGWGGKGLRKNF